MDTSAKILGGLLGYVRQKQNVTRAQLAAAHGVEEDYMRQFEAGEIDFEFDELDAILEKLGMDGLDYFGFMKEFLAGKKKEKDLLN